MIEDIQDYINKMRDVGKSDDEIKEGLLKVGWKEEDIILQKPKKKFIGNFGFAMLIGDVILLLGVILLISSVVDALDDSSIQAAFINNTFIFVLWALGYIFSIIGLVFGIIRKKQGNKYTVLDKILLVIFFIPFLITISFVFLGD